MYVPIKNAWQLNERHYGALQGLDKQETVAKYGIDQVTVWRRSYDIPPPPCEKTSEHYPANIEKYKSVPESHTIDTESLKVVILVYFFVISSPTSTVSLLHTTTPFLAHHICL